jgi:hypothetical protein
MADFLLVVATKRQLRRVYATSSKSGNTRRPMLALWR